MPWSPGGPRWLEVAPFCPAIRSWNRRHPDNPTIFDAPLSIRIFNRSGSNMFWTISCTLQLPGGNIQDAGFFRFQPRITDIQGITNTAQILLHNAQLRRVSGVFPSYVTNIQYYSGEKQQQRRVQELLQIQANNKKETLWNVRYRSHWIGWLDVIGGVVFRISASEQHVLTEILIVKTWPTLFNHFAPISISLGKLAKQR